MPNETYVKKNKCVGGAEDKVIRNLEAKQQASKGLWWTKDEMAGSKERRGATEHFAVKGKKEQFEMMLNSHKDTQIKYNIPWFITP